MKKVLAIMAFLAISLSNYANYVEINGLFYNLDLISHTAEVTYGDDYYVGAVTIPKTITYSRDTYNVTSIGNNAFSYCSSLTSVTIPNSVTSIGESAFKDCDGLTSVAIGNSVQNIGEEAFSSCGGLTSVTIPNSVTSIGRSAFEFCI